MRRPCDSSLDLFLRCKSYSYTSDLATTIGFVAVAVLVCYLYFKHQKRTYRVSYDADSAQWTGHPIDATELNRKLQKVRSDYLAARATPRGVCFHRSLLGFTRRTIARLAYFRDKPGNEARPGDLNV